MQHTKFILIVYLVFATSHLMAQSKTNSPEKLKQLPISCVKDVKIDSNLVVRFECRAIKFKKTWVLIVNDSVSNYVMRLQPETMKLVATTDFFTQGMLRVVGMSSFKLKQKEKKIDDLLLYRYFMPKKKAKKQMKVLLQLESPADVPKGIGKLFNIF